MPVRFGSSITLEHLEQLVVLCPVAIAHIDARQSVRYCNPAFEDLFGYRAREALGRRLESLIGIEDDEAAIAFGRGHGKPGHLTTRARRKDHTAIEIEVDVIPRTRTGPSTGVWVIFRDVTALRSAEATLSKATQTMLDAHERERFRIAKELHDDVAQRLTVLQIGIERLKSHLPSGRGDVKTQLEALQAEAKEISASVRTLSLDLDVPTLSLLAIDKALERLCDDVTARRGIKIHCRSSHVPRSVPHDVSLALFRVVQDALNLPEHTAARPVRIMLTGTPGMIQLDIQDLGPVRIDESDVGLRLLTMRERVAMVNGTFLIAAPSAGATEIDIRIPLSGG